MKIIGLTGSIAMGKSEVAKVFRQANIPVFDSDAAVHELYNSRRGAELIAPFAPEATTPTGVKRNVLAQIVTENPEVLTKLEHVIHQEVKQQRRHFLEDERSTSAEIVVFDIPLLFESGAEIEVDLVVVVSSSLEQQKQRALARSGMTEERLKLILSRQLPDSEKRKRAHFVIENNGSIEDLQHKTRKFIQNLRQPGTTQHA